MITKIQAYTSVPSVDTLELAIPGSEATDPIQITNIDGLDPVKATVNTTPYAAVDGENYDGSQVPSRNIVMTLRPNPDYSTWSPEALRQLIYSYFLPKSSVKLVFTSDELDDVQITGIVDSVEANPFSQDPEFIISLICVDPYFTAVAEVVVSGTVITPGGSFDTVTNHGNIPVGFRLQVNYDIYGPPNYIQVSIASPNYSDFIINPNIDPGGPADSGNYFIMSSVPTKKYARVVSNLTGVFYYVVTGIQEEVNWPYLSPKDNQFAVIAEFGADTWELRYFEKYGGF